MAKRVKRGTKVGSRLKKLKLDSLKDSVAAIDHFLPISGAENDGSADVTGHTRKRAGRKGDAGGVDASLDVHGARENEGDVAIALDIAVTRKGEGGFGHGQSDGFDRGREAYDAYLKGNVKQDAERFRQLAAVGVVDTFDPALSPDAVEARGHIQCAKHMVRLYDHWTLNDVGRDEAIERAAHWLSGFHRTDNIRKVLLELESTPIRDIYPLEVMLKMLELHPHRLDGIRPGTVLGGALAAREEAIYAGHAVQIPVPPNTRLKSFALLGGQRPGYEFFPSPKEGFYTLQIDTPGEWELALYAVRTESLGKMERELPGGILETLRVKVVEMGRKDATVH